MSPSPHQMSIQKCDIQDGQLDDIRDYSGKKHFMIVSLCFMSCFLVPVYILAVFSVILVICFICFFHCEYRRQKKDEIEHNTVVVNTEGELA